MDAPRELTEQADLFEYRGRLSRPSKRKRVSSWTSRLWNGRVTFSSPPRQ
jgi:hypothetical protein